MPFLLCSGHEGLGKIWWNRFNQLKSNNVLYLSWVRIDPGTRYKAMKVNLLKSCHILCIFRYLYLTVLRDPMQRYLSEWKHVQRGSTWIQTELKCNGRAATLDEVPICYTGRYMHTRVGKPPIHPLVWQWLRTLGTFSFLLDAPHLYIQADWGIKDVFFFQSLTSCMIGYSTKKNKNLYHCL